jgi:4-amino-4-deoxy-L-arabinose transferase-like glycosyltransferase
MSKQFDWCKKRLYLLCVITLVIIYLFTRVYKLTSLPIFADEAIYIYWAQLITSDWSRYLFYPLNDGKTPLFIWALIPFLRLFTDPLFAGRLVSVLFGLGQVILTIKMVALWTKNKFWQLMGGFLVIVSFGFIFNQRLALMDSMLTFFMTLSFYFSYLACQKMTVLTSLKKFNWTHLRLILISGFSFGAALLTKFSALLFLPTLGSLLFYFLPLKKSWRSLISLCLTLIALALIGLACLYTLKFTPSFSQLFSRGDDFLYSQTEFFAHAGEILARNFNLLIQILGNYLTNLLILAAVILAIILFPRQRTPALLIISGLATLVPILFFGEVIYSRYVLPALPFFIVSFTLSLAQLSRPFLPLKIALITVISLFGVYNLSAAWWDEKEMLLLEQDKIQYLNEWSAGYGILATVNYLEVVSRSQPTLVLTEGHIGTLPDALQVYFFNRPSRNQVRIEGIGQPVKTSNLEAVQDLIDNYPRVFLVVNSHRLELPDLQEHQLIAWFARSDPNAPRMQIWQLK